MRPPGRVDPCCRASATTAVLVHCQRLDLGRVAWPDRYSEMAMSADTHMLIPEYRSEHATLKLSVDNALEPREVRNTPTTDSGRGTAIDLSEPERQQLCPPASSRVIRRQPNGRPRRPPHVADAQRTCDVVLGRGPE